MNLKQLMNDTLAANNGDISRGLKNQLTILNAFIKEDLEEKVNILKQNEIPVYSYYGLRVLEFNLEDIQNVISENNAKLDIYRSNPQELVKDIRLKEISSGKYVTLNGIGGM